MNLQSFVRIDEFSTPLIAAEEVDQTCADGFRFPARPTALPRFPDDAVAGSAVFPDDNRF